MPLLKAELCFLVILAQGLRSPLPSFTHKWIILVVQLCHSTNVYVWEGFARLEIKVDLCYPHKPLPPLHLIFLNLRKRS